MTTEGPLTPAVYQILLSLADGDRHGYGIMQEVDERTDGEIRLGPGTLYRQAHGVQVTTLTRPMRLSVEVFRIDSTTVSERPFQQHNERTLFGRYRQDSRALPAGTAVVRTQQPLGRLLFKLLEPRSSDGFLNWNVLDALLADATEYPILRAVAMPF